MSDQPTEYPDSFFESRSGEGRKDNNDLPASALALPPVLNRRPYKKES